MIKKILRFILSVIGMGAYPLLVVGYWAFDDRVTFKEASKKLWKLNWGVKDWYKDIN